LGESGARTVGAVAVEGVVAQQHEQLGLADEKPKLGAEGEALHPPLPHAGTVPKMESESESENG
jgi:hypothetical protein